MVKPTENTAAKKTSAVVSRAAVLSLIDRPRRCFTGRITMAREAERTTTQSRFQKAIAAAARMPRTSRTVRRSGRERLCAMDDRRVRVLPG